MFNPRAVRLRYLSYRGTEGVPFRNPFPPLLLARQGLEPWDLKFGPEVSSPQVLRWEGLAKLLFLKT